MRRLSPVGRGATAALILGLTVLVLSPNALAQEPAPGSQPVITVGGDGAGGPAPDPDPAPSPDTPSPSPAQASPPPASPPPSSGGGGGTASTSSSFGGSASSTASSSPASSPQPSSSQPTAAERRAEARRKRQQALRKERQRRERARLRKERERERREDAQRAAALERSKKSGFDAFVQAWSAPSTPPATQAGATPAELIEQLAASGDSAPATVEAVPAASGRDSGSSSLSSAAPILLVLLGISIVLLAAAALPSWTALGPVLTGILAQRRLEIGLLGVAVLASAAIGLVVTVVAR